MNTFSYIIVNPFGWLVCSHDDIAYATKYRDARKGNIMVRSDIYFSLTNDFPVTSHMEDDTANEMKAALYSALLAYAITD